jgi:predicted nucleotidyltransferase
MPWFRQGDEVHNTAANKAEVLRKLKARKSRLVHEFGVSGLALFGSVARDQASSRSDVDILVGFDGPATSRRYFGVQFDLEDLLGRPLDLVTEKALRAELRPYVEREAIRV